MLCMQPPGRLVQLLRGLFLTRSALAHAFEGGKRHALPRALLRMRVARGYVLVEVVHARRDLDAEIHAEMHIAMPDCSLVVQGPAFKQGEATRVTVKEVSSGHPEPAELNEMARAVVAGCCQQGESIQTAGLRAAMLEAVRSSVAQDLARPRGISHELAAPGGGLAPPSANATWRCAAPPPPRQPPHAPLHAAGSSGARWGGGADPRLLVPPKLSISVEAANRCSFGSGSPDISQTCVLSHGRGGAHAPSPSTSPSTPLTAMCGGGGGCGFGGGSFGGGSGGGGCGYGSGFGGGDSS